MSNPVKFKLKGNLVSTHQAPKHVWIIHTIADSDDSVEPTFATMIKRNVVIATLTENAAREKIVAIASEIANENGWQRKELRETGLGILKEGDMCCDIEQRNPGTGDTDCMVVEARVSAWKVEITK